MMDRVHYMMDRVHHMMNRVHPLIEFMKNIGDTLTFSTRLEDFSNQLNLRCVKRRVAALFFG